MTLARWPNDGWATIADVPKDGTGVFNYDGERPSRWKDTSDIWLHGYWTWPWADSYEKVKSIDLARKEIATIPPHGVYGYSKDRRYYAFNILEELDSPGEWYLDRKTGILYFWPLFDIAKGKAVVSIAREPLLSMRGCSNVTVSGITFEDCRGSAAEMVGGTRNLIKDCKFRNIGNVAVWVGQVVPDMAGRKYNDTTFKADAGRFNGVKGCEITRTGDAGVVLDGGDRKTLVRGGNFVEDCRIHDFSQWSRTYQPGVFINGVGNRISHNDISDAPHTAILLNGNDHVIEYNDISRVCEETGDAGAFYMGRDMSMRGNVVRYNYFHDLGGYRAKSGFSDTMAVYLDDCACGTTVYGNLFVKANRAVMIGGGRDNTVENNIFVDCSPSVHVDARGTGWAKDMFNPTDGVIVTRLKAVNFDKPPYSARYPGLADVLNDEPGVPKGNRIDRNVSVGGKWIDLLDGLTDKTVEIRDDLVGTDPGFVAPEKGDYRLNPDSPALKMGFKPLPLGKFGPR